MELVIQKQHCDFGLCSVDR